MSGDLSDQILIGSARERGTARFRRWGLIAVPLAAILFQVYVPLFFPLLAYLEMPLLVTVYFSIMRRSQIAGIFIGATIGLVQDSLSLPQPIGMFGVIKTLVGYFAASVGMRFDVDHVFIRFVLALFFFIFHQFFYWVMARALLGQQVGFDIQQTVIVGLLNAAVGVSLYHFLDKLKEPA
jgi:rod shape-determining protein MreD